MLPVLISIDTPWGTWTLASYPAMQACAALVFVLGGAWLLRRELTLLPRLLLVTSFVIALYLGSRLGYYVLSRIGPEQSAFAGMWLPAGAACAIATLAIGSRWLRQDAWRVADQLASIAYLSMAIARVGCLLRGCCFGEETDWFWGQSFPRLSPVHLHQSGSDLLKLLDRPDHVHPTQSLEIASAVLISGFASIALTRRWFDHQTGRLALSCGLLFALARGAIAILRADDVHLPTWANGPTSSSVVIIMLAIVWIGTNYTHRRSGAEIA